MTDLSLTKTEQVLLDTIKKALFDGDIRFPEDTDWTEVLKEAKAQTIVGVVAQGVPVDVQEQWKGEAAHGMATYVRILHAHGELIRLLDQKGIPAAILKGMAAAVYYPIPRVRTFGDIDCIVPEDRFEETRQILREHGYREEREPESPRHIAYHKDGVEIELHRRFSYEDLDMERYVIDGFQHLERRSVDSIEVPILPKLANGLVLLMHMRQHLKSGLGLRQVLDWMMYVHSELTDSFWNEEFENAVDELGLKALSKTATRMCQLYLGLTESISWCLDADETLCGELLHSLLSSGNFGRKAGTMDGKAERVATDIQRIGLFRKLQQSGQINWKAYKRHSWLKPFCWIYQIARYAIQLIQNRKSLHLQKDKSRADQRVELLRRLNIA